jgi:hypothetical protein
VAKPTDFVQGTLDLLILKTIPLEPKHGWAIAKRIQQVSREALQIQQGSAVSSLLAKSANCGSCYATASHYCSSAIKSTTRFAIYWKPPI